MPDAGLDSPSFSPIPPERGDRAALELLERKREELQGVLGRHGVPPEEAPRLVAEALLAVGAEAGGGATHGGRLLRALEVSCSRWAMERDRAARAGADADDAFAALLRSVARRLDARRHRLLDEQKAAPRLVRELLAMSPREREAAPAQHRFRSWPVVDQLLEAARKLCFEDPRRALEASGLAGHLADRLDPAGYGTSALRDLRARICMTSANARRILYDLGNAEREFDRAEQLLDEGSLDPRLRAELLRLRAGLRRYQRRLDESSRLLDQALAIYRWIGDNQQYARTLLNKAVLLEHGGDEQRRTAIGLVRQALDTLDPNEDPRLQMVALQILASHHLRLDEVDQAAALLPRILALCPTHGGHQDHLRVRWLQGLVALGQGEESGEKLLLEVRQRFLEDGVQVTAALVTLDLAVLYLQQGRTAETRRLMDETVLLFTQHRIGREAMAALLIFQEATRLEKATIALAREAYSALERSPTHVGGASEQPS